MLHQDILCEIKNYNGGVIYNYFIINKLLHIPNNMTHVRLDFYSKTKEGIQLHKGITHLMIGGNPKYQNENFIPDGVKTITFCDSFVLKKK